MIATPLSAGLTSAPLPTPSIAWTARAVETTFSVGTVCEHVAIVGTCSTLINICGQYAS